MLHRKFLFGIIVLVSCQTVLATNTDNKEDKVPDSDVDEMLKKKLLQLGVVLKLLGDHVKPPRNTFPSHPALQPTEQPWTCPNNSFCSRSYNGKKFIMPKENKDNKTFTDCQRYCAGISAKLISIHSSEENSFVNQWVQNYFTNSFNIILGGKREGKGTYEWLDGTPMNYTNWMTTYPIFDFNCMFMFTDSTWLDSECESDIYRMICEKPC